jgi:TetR/AcrR family transcriptional regulator, cholesterol catabolism regulator
MREKRERMRNKTEQILQVAAKLFARKGYGETSFQEIADIVKLHKSTLFHYFRNKEELLLKILEKPIEKVGLDLERIVNDKGLEPEEKLKKAIENHLRIVTAHADTVNIFLNEIRNLSRKNKSPYMQTRKRYQREFMKIIIEMKSKGHFDGLDPNIITLGILGMLNWVVKWYKKGGPYNLDEISGIFYRLINPSDKQNISLLRRKDRGIGKSF